MYDVKGISIKVPVHEYEPMDCYLHNPPLLS